MKATIEIHRAEYPDPKPIHLEKSHDDLNVLRHWQNTILNKQGDDVLVIGSIDKFEAFVRGRKCDDAQERLDRSMEAVRNYFEQKLSTP